jgi:uncharacterized protein YceK
VAKVLNLVVFVVLLMTVGCSSTLTFKTREQSMRAEVRANGWAEPADSGYAVRDSVQEDLLVDRMMHKKSKVKPHQGYQAIVVNFTDSSKVIEIYKRTAIIIVDLVAGPFFMGEGEIDTINLPSGLYENRVYSVDHNIEKTTDVEVTIMPTSFKLMGEDSHPNAVFGAISPRWTSSRYYGGRSRLHR